MSSRSDGFFPQTEKRSQYDKGYQQGRADAIDEFTEKLIAKKIYTETEEGWSGYTINADDVIQVAEQIKEQK